jgi:hypothetical protein
MTVSDLCSLRHVDTDIDLQMQSRDTSTAQQTIHIRSQLDYCCRERDDPIVAMSQMNAPKHFDGNSKHMIMMDTTKQDSFQSIRTACSRLRQRLYLGPFSRRIERIANANAMAFRPRDQKQELGDINRIVFVCGPRKLLTHRHPRVRRGTRTAKDSIRDTACSASMNTSQTQMKNIIAKTLFCRPTAAPRWPRITELFWPSIATWAIVVAGTSCHS